MPLSAARLSAALARRLAPVVPPPFRVRADGADVTVEHPAGWGFTSGVGSIMDAAASPEYDHSWAETGPWDEPTDGERAETAVRAVLNSLQDAVSEATGEPWPEAAPRRMAEYGARHDARALYFWYGSENAPVVAFAPMALADLTAAEE